MIKVPCYNAEGAKVSDIDVDESVFGDKVLAKTTHQMIVGMLAHKRQGTHSSKHRGEVAGSAKRPWRQKGTGRARHGSRRSPIWRGGGKVHSPKPRDYNPALPKQMRRAALDSALLSKFADAEVVVIEGLKLDKPKTKTIAALFKKIGIKTTALIGMATLDVNLFRSARNIERVGINEIRNFNAYDVLRHKQLVLTREALNGLLDARKQKQS